MYVYIASAVVAAVVMFIVWRGFTSRRSAGASSPAAPSSGEREGHPITLNPEEKIPMKLVDKKVGA